MKSTAAWVCVCQITYTQITFMVTTYLSSWVVPSPFLDEKMTQAEPLAQEPAAIDQIKPGQSDSEDSQL